MRRIQELVAAVAGDDSTLQNLRFDPASLARSLSLDPEHLAALHSAERFFASEKPILNDPATTPTPAPAGPGPARVILPIPSLGQELVATADTGTLHTGPTSGTYTISSSAAFAETVPVPGPPRPSPPTTPGGPAGPSAPVTPLPPRPHPAPGAPVSPVAPVCPVPGQPSTPSCPPSPGGPSAGPPERTPQPPGPAADHHACCHAAITAMVTMVGTTADTALVALTAIARQRRPSGGRHTRRPAP